MSILIKDVLHNNHITDVFIDSKKFSQIAPNIKALADITINGKNKAILPAFYNMHTHAAMNLLKGVSDDKELFDWLQKDIWPREEKLDSEMVYHGTRLAILEMIKSGTVGFFDMYGQQSAIIKAADEMGVRAGVTAVAIDLFDPAETQKHIETIENFFSDFTTPSPSRIFKALSAHAVYTVSRTLFNFVTETIEKYDTLLNIHACETQKEVDDCYKYKNCSPIELLDKHRLIGPKTVLAHSIFLSDKDIDIILRNGATVCTNPASNLKLASGIFSLQKLLDKGVKVTLGTDGSASNNSVNMITEMKFCSLLAKIKTMDPKAGKAEDVFKLATQNGAEAMGFDTGVIAEGKLADCILVDLNSPLMVPNYNIISNMVYSADSSVVDTVICNGKVLMQNRHVEGEDEIIATAKEIAKKLA